MASYQPEKKSNNEGRRRPETDPNIVVGAGAVGAVAGLLVGGPLLAVGLGAGAMGLAAAGNNKAGDAARSTGKLGVSAYEKGKDLNERHHIGEKVKAGVHTTVEKVKEIDREHNVVEKTKDGAMKAWDSLRQFDQKHRVTARTGQAISKGAEGLADAINPKDKDGSGTRSSTTRG